MSAQYIFTTHKLSRRYPPDKEVLTDISLSFYPGAKIGVLGYNGAGKSSLLKIMAGMDTEFDGHAQLAPKATVGLLEQEPQLDPAKDVKGNVEDGVAEIRALLDRFNELSMNYSDETADEFARIQEQIDAVDGWNLDTTLEYAMDALRCPPADADVTLLIQPGRSEHSFDPTPKDIENSVPGGVASISPETALNKFGKP